MAQQLRAAGYDVNPSLEDGPDLLRRLRQDPPAAVVIDLSRQPSHGRDMGIGIRLYKDTRRVPLLLIGGDPEKVARIHAILPDAVYGAWSEVREALSRAIAHPPAHPVVPESRLAGYSGTPLVKKLGIKAGATIALVGAPQGFLETLGQLPEGVTLRDEAGASCDLILWFIPSRDVLQRDLEQFVARLDRGSLWIAWPKKTSRLATDLTQQAVREAGLAAGWVDYKICAIDETWSALLFARRKPEKTGS